MYDRRSNRTSLAGLYLRGERREGERDPARNVRSATWVTTSTERLVTAEELRRRWRVAYARIALPVYGGIASIVLITAIVGLLAHYSR